MSEIAPVQEQTPRPALTDAERTNLERMLSFPLDLPPTFVAWMEERMRLLLSAGDVTGFEAAVFRAANPVGGWLVVPEDLTANTGEYLYTDSRTGLEYLYCNGVSGGVSKTDYADLYAYWGASKWGADVGGNFLLPDARGRSLWLAGTHADVDLGDNDGVTESSRRPKHTHTIASITVAGESAHTHAPGSLATSNSGAHTHTVANMLSNITAGEGTKIPPDGIQIQSSAPTTSSDGNHTHTFSGATAAGSSHTHTLSGSGGSGMSGSDAVAHLVYGSLLVRTGR